MNEQIKTLYENLQHKGNFITLLANELNMSRKYISNYWFPSCDVTKKHQAKVLQLLQNTLNEQENAHK